MKTLTSLSQIVLYQITYCWDHVNATPVKYIISCYINPVSRLSSQIFTPFFFCFSQMNSLILVVMGLLLLTAELIPAAPAPYFDEDAVDLMDPLFTFNDDTAVKRSAVMQRNCIFTCLTCSQNTQMTMPVCISGCKSAGRDPSKARAYNACHKYLHSGRK